MVILSVFRWLFNLRRRCCRLRVVLAVCFWLWAVFVAISIIYSIKTFKGFKIKITALFVFCLFFGLAGGRGEIRKARNAAVTPSYSKKY